MVCGLLLASQGPSLWTHSYQTPPRTGRILQQSREIDWEDIFDFDDAKSVAGYVLGCISAAFYVFAQIPQIIKNVSIIVYKCNLQSNFVVIIYAVQTMLCRGSFSNPVHTGHDGRNHVLSGYIPLLCGPSVPIAEIALDCGEWWGIGL